jgi:putative oxidoreductase
MFASTDGMAANLSDIIALIARLLIGWLFLTSGWGKLVNTAGAIGYLTSLGVPSPSAMAWVVLISELVIGIALILGIATRYASLYGVVFVVIATAIAHRYWAYPAPQQGAQYVQFIKNLAIIGGCLMLFAGSGGRYSVDAKLR